MESREERFKRIAQKRVNIALEKIRLIGNLACPNYIYTPDQTEKIITALRTSIADVESKFKSTSQKNKTNFEL